MSKGSLTCLGTFYPPRKVLQLDELKILKSEQIIGARFYLGSRIMEVFPYHDDNVWVRDTKDSGFGKFFKLYSIMKPIKKRLKNELQSYTFMGYDVPDLVDRIYKEWFLEV